jgi:hypothetical protein
MTETQHEALHLLNAHNIGAVITRLGWTWPDHVRKSEAAAGEVVRVLAGRPVETSNGSSDSRSKRKKIPFFF